MPLVIFVMVVVAILSVVIYNYASTEILQVRNDHSRQQAEYLARTSVIATMAAWKDTPDSQRASVRKSSTIYQKSDGSYSSTSDGAIGLANVNITPTTKTVNGISVSVVEFEATGNVNGIIKKVSAFTTPIGDGQTMNWFDNNGIFLGSASAEITNQVNSQVNDNLSNQNISFLVNTFNGIVKCQTSGNLHMTHNNSKNKVILAAQSLFINSPVMMDSQSSEQQVLVCNARDVYFNGPITLYSNQWYDGLGSTIVFTYPLEQGYKMDDGQYYGKIYFGGDVKLVVPHSYYDDVYTLFTVGSTYLYKLDPNKALDLVKFASDTQSLSSSVTLFSSSSYTSADMKKVTDTQSPYYGPQNPESLMSLIWD